MSAQRLLAYVLPALVAVVLLAFWEWAVGYFEIQPFVLPAPSAIAQTFVTEWAVARGVGVGHADDHRRGVLVGADARVFARRFVRAKPDGRAGVLAVRGDLADNADRRDRAADLDLGRRRSRRPRGADPCDDRRLLSHTRQHDAGLALDRSAAEGAVSALWRLTAADASEAADSQRRCPICWPE